MGMNSIRVLVINDELCDVSEQVAYEEVRQKQIVDTVKGKLLKGTVEKKTVEGNYRNGV